METVLLYCSVAGPGTSSLWQMERQPFQIFPGGPSTVCFQKFSARLSFQIHKSYQPASNNCLIKSNQPAKNIIAFMSEDPGDSCYAGHQQPLEHMLRVPGTRTDRHSSTEHIGRNKPIPPPPALPPNLVSPLQRKRQETLWSKLPQSRRTRLIH